MTAGGTPGNRREDRGASLRLRVLVGVPGNRLLMPPTRQQCVHSRLDGVKARPLGLSLCTPNRESPSGRLAQMTRAGAVPPALTKCSCLLAIKEPPMPTDVSRRSVLVAGAAATVAAALGL
jgi:hypothetical protein